MGVFGKLERSAHGLSCLINFLQEEHPPIISNFGMGSALVNYYRKKNEKDEHIPKVRTIRTSRDAPPLPLRMIGRPWRSLCP